MSMNWLKVGAVVAVASWLVGCGNEGASKALDIVKWDPAYTKNWAPAIGAALPTLSVKDTGGAPRSFADLTGDQGLLIFFVRSSNW